jgi:transposase
VGSTSNSAAFALLTAKFEALSERLASAEERIIDAEKRTDRAEARADKAERKLQEKEEELGKAKQHQAWLEHQLAQLKRLIFGTKSERFVPAGSGQLLLFADAPVDVGARAPDHQIVVRRTPKRKPVRQVLPTHLPREIIILEPKEDTSKLKRIGEEILETLDYRPAKLTVIQRVRPKYVDPADEDRGVIIAELPRRPIDKGIAEPGLLAHVLVEKYVDHLPLYRQVQRFKREGIRIAESTIGDWTASAANLLLRLKEPLWEDLVADGYIQVDETTIPVLDRNKPGKTHRGYYWLFHAPTKGLVLIDYHPGRARAGPERRLECYQGALQTDGYSGYAAFDRRPGVTGYRCWAHARRHFFEAKKNAPQQVEHVLAEIQQLYAIEGALRDRDASHDERRKIRQDLASEILDRLKAWLEQNRGLPREQWGKAVRYTLNNWQLLVRYVDDGQIEIDNNLVENAVRPVALGRKNYLFSGSHQAAERASVVYSLLATCKRHDVNPYQWLTDVLTRLPTHPDEELAELLPHNWKNGRQPILTSAPENGAEKARG